MEIKEMEIAMNFFEIQTKFRILIKNYIKIHVFKNL